MLTTICKKVCTTTSISIAALSVLFASSSFALSDDLEMQAPLVLYGQWISESDGSTMLDPQTSGLIADADYLWTVSDASAHDSQIQRLHKLDKKSASIVERLGPLTLSDSLENSCFATYLATSPDYEAMVFHPFLDDAWILVTEDASRSEPLSPDCQQAFSNTGSTLYPSLLVEIVYREQKLMVSGVRALQFDQGLAIGNFPNDGIEGLALGRNNRLYLGLEKDSNTQPRILYIDLQENTFDSIDTFLAVNDANLKLPNFTQGNHPINGMDIYFPHSGKGGFLIAAARNDNQLWVVDLAKQHSTKIIPLSFMAPSESRSCAAYHKMDNASLEGLAVDGDTLYMINDPWKVNYLKNVSCDDDESNYKRMSPLLFKTRIQESWFE